MNDLINEIKGKIQANTYDSKTPINYSVVKRKYCFEYEIKNERNEEIECLKLTYSFKYKPLNSIP